MKTYSYYNYNRNRVVICTEDSKSIQHTYLTTAEVSSLTTQLADAVGTQARVLRGRISDENQNNKPHHRTANPLAWEEIGNSIHRGVEPSCVPFRGTVPGTRDILEVIRNTSGLWDIVIGRAVVGYDLELELANTWAKALLERMYDGNPIH